MSVSACPFYNLKDTNTIYLTVLIEFSKFSSRCPTNGLHTPTSSTSPTYSPQHQSPPQVHPTSLSASLDPADASQTNLKPISTSTTTSHDFSTMTCNVTRTIEQGYSGSPPHNNNCSSRSTPPSDSTISHDLTMHGLPASRTRAHKVISSQPVQPHQPARISESSKKRKNMTKIACNACRTSKLKCDGSKPSCASCEKKGVECEYQEKHTRQRQRRRTTSELNAAPSVHESSTPSSSASTSMKHKPFEIDDDDEYREGPKSKKARNKT